MIFADATRARSVRRHVGSAAARVRRRARAEGWPAGRDLRLRHGPAYLSRSDLQLDPHAATRCCHRRCCVTRRPIRFSRSRSRRSTAARSIDRRATFRRATVRPTRSSRISGDSLCTSSLRPELASQLIVGGLPRSRLPLLAGVFVLTAGLLGVALAPVAPPAGVGAASHRVRVRRFARAAHAAGTDPLVRRAAAPGQAALRRGTRTIRGDHRSGGAATDLSR